MSNLTQSNDAAELAARCTRTVVEQSIRAVAVMITRDTGEQPSRPPEFYANEMAARLLGGASLMRDCGVAWDAAAARRAALPCLLEFVHYDMELAVPGGLMEQHMRALRHLGQQVMPALDAMARA